MKRESFKYLTAIGYIGDKKMSTQINQIEMIKEKLEQKYGYLSLMWWEDHHPTPNEYTYYKRYENKRYNVFISHLISPNGERVVVFITDRRTGKKTREEYKF